MPIKFSLTVLRPKSGSALAKAPKNNRILSIACCLLPVASSFLVSSPTLAAEKEVLGVVRSGDNASQWASISKRLQASGVNYCIIDLVDVRSATDLSDRPVVFLPGVETLTPAQAIALEAWVSRGGKVITSGAVGDKSQPGVRQLLRSLLGAYWGYGFRSPSKLQPLKTNHQQWVRDSLGGTAWGGAVVPTSVTSQTAAIWQVGDTPSAVVTTERATILGWNWGATSAANPEFDTNWLRAALSRHVKLATNANIPNPKNCNGSIASATPVSQSTNQTQVKPTWQNNNSSNLIQSVATGSSINRVPNATRNQLDEPIDRLAPRGLVPPNSKAPISSVEAFALQQELNNLIGRFESAQLAANSRGNSPVSTTEIASSKIRAVPQPTTQALIDAKKIAERLPQLVKARNYTAARQEWLKASQLLWKHYPTDRPLAQSEIRAIWLDRGTIVRAGSEQGLAKVFDKLAAAGINTVFLETVNAGYPIYPSKVAPQSNPLIRGWDPLASGVKLAHQRGMELHAWVWAFAAGNQRHNKILNLPANYPGPVISAHPDWASYDNRGSLFPYGQAKPFLDPANPAARKYLLDLYDEIASRYDIDGFQLDYIRYPFQDPSADRTYGYGRAARQQFKQLTGVDPTKISPRDRVLWQKWTDFRTKQIDSFVAQVSRQLKAKRPNIITSVAVFPLSEAERLQKLQQHWEVWARRGDVDLVIPMTYALDTYRFQRLAQPWIGSIKLGSALVVPGIRLLNLSLPVAVDQIQLSRDLPISGYALFAAENLDGDLQTIFQRTQGNEKEPIPYRQPFHTAAARFMALQQEWSYLAENNQLVLPNTGRSSFNAKAQVLEEALNELADRPSARRLTVAKAALLDFETQFTAWMRFHRVKNPYQFKVWSNRLDTLDRLLVYGDRIVLQQKLPPVAENKR
ncbi:family 10 glycosylhydrolase [Aliterella atlantica]|uniref:Glycosyl hydrolase-like 10 domain-containing protein n=1 Tax=Aliterella atlantica CENA595 TaxID=1618023 RepID=A0A0D8ZR74_9CYAN|nr:family 10 glycosylhydrolase [Aliterella atlantica]KJH69691.1 hypothetical protein UH38_22460 [Aliterella atlantica CENA595]